MPKPISQREMVRRLKRLGWQGPHQQGSHPYMVKESRRLTIPNPRRGQIDWSLTRRILAQGGISPAEWEACA